MRKRGITNNFKTCDWIWLYSLGDLQQPKGQPRPVHDDLEYPWWPLANDNLPGEFKQQRTKLWQFWKTGKLEKCGGLYKQTGRIWNIYTNPKHDMRARCTLVPGLTKINSFQKRLPCCAVLLAQFLGGISFPIFIVHGPLGQLFYKKAGSHKCLPRESSYPA